MKFLDGIWSWNGGNWKYILYATVLRIVFIQVNQILQNALSANENP